MILEKRKTHLYQIDLVRLVAILSVVMCHAVQGIYPLTVDFMVQYGLKGTAFSLLLFTFGRIGVPLFLMVSGYLLLDRDYDAERTKYFLKNNWLKLIITVEIWVVIYKLFLVFFEHQPFHELDQLEEMLFLRHVPLTHYWYIPTIIGLYLLIPFVANAIKSFSGGAMTVILVILSVYTFVMPIFGVVLTAFGYPNYQDAGYFHGQGLSVNLYLLYLVYGYFIKKGFLKDVKWIYLLILSVSGFVLAYLFQIMCFSRFVGYIIWYDNGLLLLATVPLFELLLRIKDVKLKPLVRALGVSSFGVYLLHVPVQKMIAPLMWFTDEMPIQVILSFIISLVISFAVVLLVGRIPKVGKWLFYLK